MLAWKLDLLGNTISRKNSKPLMSDYMISFGVQTWGYPCHTQDPYHPTKGRSLGGNINVSVNLRSGSIELFREGNANFHMPEKRHRVRTEFPDRAVPLR